VTRGPDPPNMGLGQIVFILYFVVRNHCQD
jgi:hypothetical protein